MAIVNPITPTAEVQTVTVDATGGTFDLTWNGATATVAFDASAATFTTAMDTVTDRTGECVVTGGPGAAGGGTPYTLTWAADKGNVPAPTTDVTNLTGGAGTAVVATGTVIDSGETVTGSDTLGSVPYVNPFTADAIVSRRVITSSNVATSGSCDTIAAQQLGRFDQPQREITLSTDAYSISDTVQAGDTIHVFDVDNDLYDTTNPVQYRGRLMYPAKVRVTTVTQNCSSELGYYLYSWTGSAQELHDLTPYVAFESAGVSLELGEPRRLRPTTPTAITG